MKKLYLRLFIILLVFILLSGSLQFLPLPAGARAGLDILVLLAFMALVLAVLKSGILDPLRAINRGLQLLRQPGNGRLASAPAGLMDEVGEIYASVENIHALLHKKTSEASEAREFLEKLMQTTQAIVIQLDRGMHFIYMNAYGLRNSMPRIKPSARCAFRTSWKKDSSMRSSAP